jgi:hypothetical protein
VRRSRERRATQSGLALVAAAAALLWGFAASTTPAPASASAPRDTTRDRSAIVALEHTWLGAQDRPTLERLLAPDFVHIVPGGAFLTRAEHIAWVTAHPRPASTKMSFGSLRVRLYGTVAVANGVVLARPAKGPARRSAFTDVFVFRDGRWQAVNAQEDLISR